MIENIWGLKCWCYFCEILVWKRRKKNTYKCSSWLLFFRIYLHFTFLEKKICSEKININQLLRVMYFESNTVWNQSNLCTFYFQHVIHSTIHVQSVPINTKVVSSNLAHSEVHLIQHYVIKFVSDLQQVGGFLWVLWFPPPIKLTVTI
jgi:hypothetical protein